MDMKAEQRRDSHIRQLMTHYEGKGDVVPPIVMCFLHAYLPSPHGGMYKRYFEAGSWPWLQAVVENLSKAFSVFTMAIGLSDNSAAVKGSHT